MPKRIVNVTTAEDRARNEVRLRLVDEDPEPAKPDEKPRTGLSHEAPEDFDTLLGVHRDDR